MIVQSHEVLIHQAIYRTYLVLSHFLSSLLLLNLHVSLQNSLLEAYIAHMHIIDRLDLFLCIQAVEVLSERVTMLSANCLIELGRLDYSVSIALRNT